MNMLTLTKMTVGDAALTAVLGYAVVFVGILLLILVVSAVGRVMSAKKPEKAAPAAPAVTAEPKKPEVPAAPGSCGELKLYDTDSKTAAMIMAIVADKMGKPLNELRFKSIKEVK